MSATKSVIESEAEPTPKSTQNIVKRADTIEESDKTLVEGLKVDLKRNITGQKRGRKSRAISDYVEHTENRIRELKAQLENPETEESQKPKIRNQISAFQARMKAKIQSTGLENKMRKVQDQISGIMQIANQFIPSEQLAMFQSKVKQNFPELKF